MKKKRKDRRILDSKPKGSGGKFHEIKSGMRKKGAKAKKPLPPWRDVSHKV